MINVEGCGLGRENKMLNRVSKQPWPKKEIKDNVITSGVYCGKCGHENTFFLKFVTHYKVPKGIQSREIANEILLYILPNL